MELLDKDLLSLQETRTLISKAKKAHDIYKMFSQSKVDSIVKAVAEAAEKEAVRLAKMAHEETGFGIWQDKVVKNTFASRVVYESIKDLKTVGIIKENDADKYFEVGMSLGVIAALIPSTNPTSTTMYKTLISIKSGNAVVISAHPNAKNCIVETAKILSDAATKAGAPEGLIGCTTMPSLGATTELMKHNDTALILATGGEAMVKAAYSSGTPAIGVGPGNGPSFIDKSADVKLAVKRILASKTFDNGVICASEQSIVVESCMEEAVKEELIKQGAYFLNEVESKKLGKFILRANGTMNPQIVGKSVEKLAEMSGLNVKEGARVLISEETTVGKNNPYSREKLTPILAFYTVDNLEAGIKLCIEILMNEGRGHTSTLHAEDKKVIEAFALRMPVARLLINTSGTFGGLGATTNLVPALTLGCGAIGGSSTSDNIGPLNLLNIKKVAFGVKEQEEVTGAKATEVNATETSMSKDQLELIIRKVVEQLSALS